MWKRKLIKNKIYAVVLIIIGALSVPIEWDATFFLFTLIIGVPMFFAKENWIYEGDEDDGTSREKACSEIRAESEDRYIQSHKSTARRGRPQTGWERAGANQEGSYR